MGIKKNIFTKFRSKSVIGSVSSSIPISRVNLFNILPKSQVKSKSHEIFKISF